MVALAEPKPTPLPAPKAAKNVSREARRAFEEGNHLLDRGKYAEAVAAYGRATKLSPSFAEAHYNRGVGLFALRSLDEALVAFDRAIELRDNFAEAHNRRGFMLLCVDGGDLKDALASFDLAIKLRPDYADAHVNRATVLHDLGRLEEAYQAVQRALALAPEDESAILLRGLILDSLLRRLATRRIVSGRSAKFLKDVKPKGSTPPIPITPGPPVSDYVIEDRR